MNIEIAIKNASKELKKNKISSALLDSELLLSKVINKDRQFILLNLNKMYRYHSCLMIFYSHIP